MRLKSVEYLGYMIYITRLETYPGAKNKKYETVIVKGSKRWNYIDYLENKNEALDKAKRYIILLEQDKNYFDKDNSNLPENWRG